MSEPSENRSARREIQSAGEVHVALLPESSQKVLGLTVDADFDGLHSDALVVQLNLIIRINFRTLSQTHLYNLKLIFKLLYIAKCTIEISKRKTTKEWKGKLEERVSNKEWYHGNSWETKKKLHRSSDD